jgi:hypothetical protein
MSRVAVAGCHGGVEVELVIHDAHTRVPLEGGLADSEDSARTGGGR